MTVIDVAARTSHDLALPQLRPRASVATATGSARRRANWGLLLCALALLLGADRGPVLPPDTGFRAYFFGDSLMSGTGSTPARPVMARVAAARLGWRVDVDAWGGTGYTTSGRSPSYLSRLQLPDALRGAYDVVVLEGGTNDAHVGSSPAAVRHATRQVVHEVQRRQPAAQVVLVGAYDPPGAVDLRRSVADAAVQDVADELGLPFLSPLAQGWHAGQDPRRFLDDDGLHPNEYGYGVLGERLAQALAAVVRPAG